MIVDAGKRQAASGGLRGIGGGGEGGRGEREMGGRFVTVGMEVGGGGGVQAF